MVVQCTLYIQMVFSIQYIYWSWTQLDSVRFTIKRRTVTTIVFLSVWKQPEIFFCEGAHLIIRPQTGCLWCAEMENKSLTSPDIMGDQLSAPIESFLKIVLWWSREFLGGVLNLLHKIDERRRPLGQLRVWYLYFSSRFWCGT